MVSFKKAKKNQGHSFYSFQGTLYVPGTILGAGDK